MNRRKLGIVFLFLGVVLILASLSLSLWNQRESQKAEAFINKALPLVLEEIEARSPTNPDSLEPTMPEISKTEMTEVEIDGYSYVGYLSIPILELKLPVMSSWSYPQLKISPCRYSGSTLSADLVIAAHNYISHFGTIQNLSVGNTLFFTDMDGVTRTYQVAEIEILPPTAVEEVTNSGYALTLFTCTYGSQSRVTVRCNQVG